MNIFVDTHRTCGVFTETGVITLHTYYVYIYYLFNATLICEFLNSL